MPRITLTIIDDNGGRGAYVVTDSDAPAIGRTRTPAQALALDLLRVCKLQALGVTYGDQAVPLVDFANAFLSPERFGLAVNPEIRDAARIALGSRPVEVAALAQKQRRAA
jgi:hypothetical protein